MAAYDGGGRCPKLKAHYICCDGDGILLFKQCQSAKLGLKYGV